MVSHGSGPFRLHDGDSSDLAPSRVKGLAGQSFAVGSQLGTRVPVVAREHAGRNVPWGWDYVLGASSVAFDFARSLVSRLTSYGVERRMAKKPIQGLDPETSELYRKVWDEDKEARMSKSKYSSGCGIDLGTMNIVAARQTTDGKVETKRVRDAFIDLEGDAKKTLRLSKVNYVEKEDQLIVLGDSALTMANLFKREVRRPLSRGVVAAGEMEAQEILSLLIHNVLGDPSSPGEHCYYSVPAAPIDDPEQDVIYHTEVFRKILSEYGYDPHPMNEAMAIIYSQCAAEQFSGVSVSYGSGMCNVALAYQTVKGLEFSLARGGDWIDRNAAKATGSTAARMCAIKEKGVNLAAPKGREEEAIALYIRALIRYTLENISAQFKNARTNIDLPEPIPFVVSGGTTLAGGFLDIFRDEFQAMNRKGFPIPISEIRLATDPMTAVAEGLLVLASEEE